MLDDLFRLSTEAGIRLIEQDSIYNGAIYRPSLIFGSQPGDRRNPVRTPIGLTFFDKDLDIIHIIDFRAENAKPSLSGLIHKNTQIPVVISSLPSDVKLFVTEDAEPMFETDILPLHAGARLTSKTTVAEARNILAVAEEKLRRLQEENRDVNLRLSTLDWQELKLLERLKGMEGLIDEESIRRELRAVADERIRLNRVLRLHRDEQLPAGQKQVKESEQLLREAQERERLEALTAVSPDEITAVENLQVLFERAKQNPRHEILEKVRTAIREIIIHAAEMGPLPAQTLVAYLVKNHADMSDLTELRGVQGIVLPEAKRAKLRDALAVLDVEGLLSRLAAELEPEVQEWMPQDSARAVLIEVRAVLEGSDPAARFIHHDEKDALTEISSGAEISGDVRLTAENGTALSRILSDVRERRSAWDAGGPSVRNLPASARILANYVLHHKLSDDFFLRADFDRFKAEAFDDEGNPKAELRTRFKNALNGRANLATMLEEAFDSVILLRDRQKTAEDQKAEDQKKVQATPEKKQEPVLTEQQKKIAQIADFENRIIAQAAAARRHVEDKRFPEALRAYLGLEKSIPALLSGIEQELLASGYSQAEETDLSLRHGRLERLSEEIPLELEIGALIPSASFFIAGLEKARVESVTNAGGAAQLDRLEGEFLKTLPELSASRLSAVKREFISSLNGRLTEAAKKLQVVVRKPVPVRPARTEASVVTPPSAPVIFTEAPDEKEEGSSPAEPNAEPAAAKLELKPLKWIEPGAGQTARVIAVLKEYLPDETFERISDGDAEGYAKRVAQIFSPEREEPISNSEKNLRVSQLVPVRKLERSSLVKALAVAMEDPNAVLMRRTTDRLNRFLGKNEASRQISEFLQKYKPGLKVGFPEGGPEMGPDRYEVFVAELLDKTDDDYPVDYKLLVFLLEKPDLSAWGHSTLIQQIAALFAKRKLMEANRKEKRYSAKDFDRLIELNYFTVLGALWTLNHMDEFNFDEQVKARLHFITIKMLAEMVLNHPERAAEIGRILGAHTPLGNEWRFYTDAFSVMDRRPGQKKSVLEEYLDIPDDELNAGYAGLLPEHRPIFTFWFTRYLALVSKQLLPAGSVLEPARRVSRLSPFEQMIDDTDRHVRLVTAFRDGRISTMPSRERVATIKVVYEAMRDVPEDTPNYISTPLLSAIQKVLGGRYTRGRIRVAIEDMTAIGGLQTKEVSAEPFKIVPAESEGLSERSQQRLNRVGRGPGGFDKRTGVLVLVTGTGFQKRSLHLLDHVQNMYFVPSVSDLSLGSLAVNHFGSLPQDALVIERSTGDHAVVTSRGGRYSASIQKEPTGRIMVQGILMSGYEKPGLPRTFSGTVEPDRGQDIEIDLLDLPVQKKIYILADGALESAVVEASQRLLRTYPQPKEEVGALVGMVVLFVARDKGWSLSEMSKKDPHGNVLDANLNSIRSVESEDAVELLMGVPHAWDSDEEKAAAYDALFARIKNYVDASGARLAASPVRTVRMGTYASERQRLESRIRSSHGFMKDLAEARRKYRFDSQSGPLELAERLYERISEREDLLEAGLEFELYFRYAPPEIIDHLNDKFNGARLAENWTTGYRVLRLNRDLNALAGPMDVDRARHLQRATIALLHSKDVQRSSHGLKWALHVVLRDIRRGLDHQPFGSSSSVLEKAVQSSDLLISARHAGALAGISDNALRKAVKRGVLKGIVKKKASHGKDATFFPIKRVMKWVRLAKVLTSELNLPSKYLTGLLSIIDKYETEEEIRKHASQKYGVLFRMKLKDILLHRTPAGGGLWTVRELAAVTGREPSEVYTALKKEDLLGSEWLKFKFIEAEARRDWVTKKLREKPPRGKKWTTSSLARELRSQSQFKATYMEATDKLRKTVYHDLEARDLLGSKQLALRQTNASSPKEIERRRRRLQRILSFERPPVGEEWTNVALAERMGVSRNVIAGDKQALSGARLADQAESTYEEGRWEHIPNGWQLPQVMIEMGEAAAAKLKGSEDIRFIYQGGDVAFSKVAEGRLLTPFKVREDFIAHLQKEQSDWQSKTFTLIWLGRDIMVSLGGPAQRTNSPLRELPPPNPNDQLVIDYDNISDPDNKSGARLAESPGTRLIKFGGGGLFAQQPGFSSDLRVAHLFLERVGSPGTELEFAL